MNLQGKTIAILATQYFEESELIEPRNKLLDMGATVKVYSADGNSIQAVKGDSEKTSMVAVDGSFEQVSVSTLDAVIVPGGTINSDTIRLDADAQEIVQDADEQGKILAVICHGPWLLVSAQLVDGRKLTSYPSLQDDIVNAGGTWIDDEVVIDENLITSRNPDDLPAFISAIADALSSEEE